MAHFVDKLPSQGGNISLDQTNFDHMRDFLNRFVATQGLIARFKLPEVRVAFLEGHFLLPGRNPEILNSIDKIAELLLPYPGFADIKNSPPKRSHDGLAAVDFFCQLQLKSSSFPKDKGGTDLPYLMSFADWSDYLQRLSRCGVWGKLSDGKPLKSVYSKSSSTRSEVKPCVEREDISSCSSGKDWPKRYVDEEDITGGDLRKSFRFGETDKKWSPWSDNRDRISKTVTPSNRSRFSRRNGGVNDRQPYMDSVSESDNDSRRGSRQRSPCHSGKKLATSTASSGDELSSGSLQVRPPQQAVDVNDLSRLLMSLQRPRDVVPPSKFSGSDGMSLRLFLTEYEQYFDMKYEGTQRQKAKHLAEYLEGPLLTAYEAMEGNRMSYPNVKGKLLGWYKTQRMNMRRQGELDFQRARMMESDTLSIYALRLERIAAKAFPDERERERQLIKKYFRTVPKYFNKALTASERSLLLVGRGRKISWEQIVTLAKDEDRKSKYKKDDTSEYSTEGSEVEVWYSQPSSLATRSSQWNNSKNVTFKDRMPSSPPHRARSFQKGFPTCNWCGKKGHFDRGCWLRLGFCQLCGSEQHTKEDCPRPGVIREEPSPKCPNCHGPHLGKDCDIPSSGDNSLNSHRLSQ